MINIKQLKDLTERTLKEYDLYSESAVNLLLGTYAQESIIGGECYLRQRPKGKFDINKHAIGLFQMEKGTFDFLHERYSLIIYGCELTSEDLKFQELEYNIKYMMLFARLKYLSISEPLPDANDIKGLAHYWNKYYNANDRYGTDQEFIDKYEKYVL